MFYIDLEKSKPIVKAYTAESIKTDLSHFETDDLMDLDDYDWRIFKTREAAETWLEKYQNTLSKLSNSTICKSRELPAMLYKRRYIVQTLLGEKLQTYRHYLKPWKKGDLINLHDQTFFLTVRIKNVAEDEDGQYRYDFEVA